MTQRGPGFYKLMMLLTIPPVALCGPLGRIVMNWGVAPMTVAFWRLAVATLGSLIMALAARPSRDALLHLPWQDWLRCAVSGLFLAAHYLCWYTALNTTTIFNATVLGNLQPFFALLGSWILFKEKVRPWAVAGIVVALAGSVIMGLLSRSGGQGSLLGDGMALLAGLFFTGYLLWGRRLSARLPLMTYTTVLYGTCLAFLGMAALVTQTPVAVSPASLGMCALLTVLGTFMGHSVFNWALPHVGAVFVTVALLGEPVGASLAAFFMFGERPTAATLAGGLLVLLGVAFYAVMENRRRPAEGEQSTAA